LAAQPEDVAQQEKEQDERVFFGDAIESDGHGIKGPQRRRYQSYFGAKQFGSQQVNEKRT
jgi:hypothetical protein